MRGLIGIVGLLLILAVPAWSQSRPDPRRAELDSLLTALKTAPSEEAAAAIEGRIRQIWVQSASPAAGLLMTRGLRDLSNDADDDALDDFDAVLVLQPDLPEGYYRRAEARFGLGDYAGAVADIREALQREPRHFAALEALSHFAESRNDFKGALAAWKKALELSPKTPDGEERLKALTRKALGEES